MRFCSSNLYQNTVIGWIPQKGPCSRIQRPRTEATIYLLVGNSGWWEGGTAQGISYFPRSSLGFPAQGITPRFSKSASKKSPSREEAWMDAECGPSVWISSVQLPSGPDHPTWQPGTHAAPVRSASGSKPSLANGTRAPLLKRAPLQWEEDRAPTALTSKALLAQPLQVLINLMIPGSQRKETEEQNKNGIFPAVIAPTICCFRISSLFSTHQEITAPALGDFTDV